MNSNSESIRVWASSPQRVRWWYALIACMVLLACAAVLKIAFMQSSEAESERIANRSESKVSDIQRSARSVTGPVAAPNTATSAPSESVLSDSFSTATFAEHWVSTFEGDFKERLVDVTDSRLRLRADTRGTDDKTVKFLGVRTARQFAPMSGLYIEADLDWNNQANGSYLSGSLIVCPVATAGNPEREQDWIKVEYIGVPPSENGRINIEIKQHGRERILYDEGWPETNLSGRKLSLQHIRLITGVNTIEFLENGKRLYLLDQACWFETAYVYLQISSHSNYPARELFFSKFKVERNPGP